MACLAKMMLSRLVDDCLLQGWCWRLVLLSGVVSFITTDSFSWFFREADEVGVEGYG